MAALFYRVALCALALFSLEVKGFDHGGNEFYVTFLPFPLIGVIDEVKLYITTPEQVPVTFTVSIPGMGYFNRATVDPGGVKEFTFNGVDYALRNTTDRSKGIIITAENEKQVFVYAAHDVYRTTDSLLVLPPHDLGATSYTYIAAMMHTVDGGVLIAGSQAVDFHALIGIVVGEDDTFLTITPNQNVNIGTEFIKAGESLLVTLARAETLLISFVGDLTGTKVTSNRPISFFSGDQCTFVPSGVYACDQIVEQLPPVEAWGRQFATAPLKTRSFDVFRIVASANSTTVIIKCTHRIGSQGYVDTFVLNEGGYTDVQVSSTDFCWMEADKRILLLQFSVGTTADSMPGDPFMALVPAVSHYANTFTLPVVDSSLNNFTHYLNIIIPAEHYQPDQIFLDDQSLQSLALEFVAIVHNGETMVYATQLEVNATTHTLIHGNSKGLLGVVSYGFVHRSSYGHIGGMQLPQLKYNSEPLTPPTALTVLEITSSSLTVSWRPPLGQFEEENTICYLINVTDTKWKSVVNEVNSTVLTIRVPELLPDHVYQVAVAAVSGERVGPSTTLFVRTSPVTESLSPPTALTVLEISSSSLTVSWRPPLGQFEEENTIHYLINVTDTKGKSVVNEVNSTVLSIRVPELLPDHVYQVAVAAVSGERVGPSTTLFATTSPATEPLTPPTVLTVLEITSSSLTVSWRPPLGQFEEENIVHYLINVTETKGKSVVNEVNSTVLSIRVPELLPDHVYQVAVAAVSGERIGPSTTLFVKTSPVTGVASSSSNMTVVITLGSLLGMTVLVVIAAVVILGIIICLCACRKKQKAKDNDTATCGTCAAQDHNVHLQENPAYDFVYPMRPKMNVYQL